MGCSPDCHNLAVTASLCLGCFAPAMSREHSSLPDRAPPSHLENDWPCIRPHASGAYISRNPRIRTFPSLQRARMGWGVFISLSHQASPWHMASCSSSLTRAAAYVCDAHSGAWAPPGSWSANLKSENLCGREVQSHQRKTL